MALTKINNYSIGDSNLSASYETLDKTRKGLSTISLSNYDNDSPPVVKVGSVFESGGALYVIDNISITPTGYTGIANSTTFYLYYDDSAGALIYSSTAPTWSDIYQGWYNGLDRAFFSMYKDSGGTLYQEKSILMSKNNYKFDGIIKVDDIAEKTVSNGVAIDGVVLKDGDINYTTRRGQTRFNPTSVSNFYTTLLPYFTGVGDSIMITGCFNLNATVGDDDPVIVTQATRTSSTVIRVFGVLFNFSSGSFNFLQTYGLDLTSGDSTVVIGDICV